MGSHRVRHNWSNLAAAAAADGVLKSRDITLLTKVCIVKAMVFPVVMYSCENWMIKKAVHWLVDAFQLWCSRRLLRVPWTARRSNQSIQKEINPEYSLEGLMLKLKLHYFAHLMQTTDFPDVRKDWRQKEKKATEDEMVGWSHQFDGYELGQTLGDGDGQGSLLCCSLQGCRVGHDWAAELNWITSTAVV